MSVPTMKQAYAFMNPLRGRSTVLLVPDRRTNLAATNFVLGCLSKLRAKVLILDTDCFYGTNAELVARGLSTEFQQHTYMLTTSQDENPKTMLVDVISQSESDAIIIDNLGALNFLLSSGEQRASVHQSYVLVRILSFMARTNNLWAVATAYRTHREDGSTKRSLIAAADIQIEVEVESSHLAFQTRVNAIWPDKRFTASSDLLLGQDIYPNVDSRGH